LRRRSAAATTTCHAAAAAAAAVWCCRNRSLWLRLRRIESAAAPAQLLRESSFLMWKMKRLLLERCWRRLAGIARMGVRLSLEDCRVVKREAARVAKLMDGRLLMVLVCGRLNIKSKSRQEWSVVLWVFLFYFRLCVRGNGQSLFYNQSLQSGARDGCEGWNKLIRRRCNKTTLLHRIMWSREEEKGTQASSHGGEDCLLRLSVVWCDRDTYR